MVARGTVIQGQYEVQDELAKFDHEVLFSGRRLSDAADVDIRIVPPSAPDEARRRFGGIAAILSRIDHENCLSALEAGQLVDNSLYTVNLAANAGPLTELVGDDVPARVFAEIGLQLLRGLEHLHSQGIVLGCVSPRGVTLGAVGATPRLQIVDFSFARIMASSGRQPACQDVEFLAPEVAAGGDADHVSDLYSVGTVLQKLTSAALPAELTGIVQRLCSPTPRDRRTTSQAMAAFEAWIASDGTAFDLGWLPSPMPTAITTGVFAAISMSGQEIVPAPASVSGQDIVPSTDIADPPMPLHQPRSSNRSLTIGLATAAAVAAGIVAYVVATGGTSTPESDSADGVVAAASALTGPPAGEVPVAAPAEDAAAAPARADDDAEPLEGNPIVWLSQVNRRDLGAVLPYRERHRLLDELASRAGVSSRVNDRWNAMLDLWQAGDAPTPCATFASALASLEESPTEGAERDLIRRIVVPTPAPGSAAGVAPDESCTGLSEAFAKYSATPRAPTSKRSSRSRSRSAASASTKSAPAPAPAAAPAPAKPKKKKSSGVATKLDDDLKGI